MLLLIGQNINTCYMVKFQMMITCEEFFFCLQNVVSHWT